MNTPQPQPAPRSGRTLGDVAAEIERRIAATAVRVRPFPHLVIDDLLPGEILSSLDGFWPDPGQLRHSNSLRRSEMVVSKLATTAQGREKAFWEALRGLTTRLGRAVRTRLQPHFSVKFRPLVGPDWRRRLGTPGYLDSDAMLANYGGVVELPPHIDNARLVVNGFVYLEDRGRTPPEPLRGTMLYRSVGFAWPTNRTLPPGAVRDFLREAGEVEWRHNRLLAYVNGPTSFHGVPRHDIGSERRRLLMFGSLLDAPTATALLDPALL